METDYTVELRKSSTRDNDDAADDDDENSYFQLKFVN